MVRDTSTGADGSDAIPDRCIDDSGHLSDGRIIRVPLRHPVCEQLQGVPMPDTDWGDRERLSANLRAVAAETAMSRLYDEYRFSWWDEDDRDRALIISGDEQDVELVTPPMRSGRPITLVRETAESEDVLPDIYVYADALSAHEVCIRGWVSTDELVSRDNLETYPSGHEQYELGPHELHGMPAPDSLGEFGLLDWY